jgi:2-succinyl-5-enolpyruvyl-6-hydroxy-3-cyclohexene-1-carboxylate synthase
VSGGNVTTARTLVEALRRSGVEHVCICPGSRSSSFALAFAEHADIRTWIHIDERSAGFFALGLARQLRAPVAVLSSSGTAAANLLPAVVEAAFSRIPIIVLTADRPPELRDVGAPQTIDQLNLYGRHAKWFVDVPVPDGSSALIRFTSASAARAVAVSCTVPTGPVHLNLPVREPLLDAVVEYEGPQYEPVVASSAPHLNLGIIAASAAQLRLYGRGVIVCGPQDDPAFPTAVATLAAALGYPVFADPLSQIRCGKHDRSAVVDCYDAFLRDPFVNAAFAPDVVLRFGALPTSKPLWERLQTLPECPQLLVDDVGSWRDPLATATTVVHADAAAFATALAVVVSAANGVAAWRAYWLAINRRTRIALTSALALDERPFDGAVFAALAECLPTETTLFVGNSMPVRDLDTFFGGSARALRFAANRGANGIDGVVSSALGAAAAGSRVVLVLGDLSFYHDSNGLLAGRLNGIDATIVVLNNDGGGIFSFLPQADVVAPERFEQLFGTATGLDVGRIAAVYDAGFSRAENTPAFRDALSGALATPGISVIEVRTQRRENVQRHRTVEAHVVAALQSVHAMAR